MEAKCARPWGTPSIKMWDPLTHVKALISFLLCQCVGAVADPVSILEELHWLLLMSGHVLADSGDGETPLVSRSSGSWNYECCSFLRLVSVGHYYLTII